jgi:5-methyltetrahydrofolate--homocysteine methyltransferase
MDILEEIAVLLEKGDAGSVESLTEKALSQNITAEDILNKGLVSGMQVVSEKFKANEIFIPEVLVAARAMTAGMKIIKPLLAQADVKARGKIVIGTVKGDLHDIGKKILGMLLEGAGFEVIDLGTDVTKEMFIESVKKDNAEVIGMSALLTTTMIYMKEVIEAVEKEDLKSKVKVIIGGAPITQAYADEIGADGYAPDAASGVDLTKNLLNIQ